VNSDLVNLSGDVYDEKLLDISLEINELLELLNMTTHPQVRQILLISIAKLEKERMTLKYKFQCKEALKPKQKWSDIVTSTHSKCSTKNGKVDSIIQSIPMIITSQIFPVVKTKQSEHEQISDKNPSSFSLQTSRNGNNCRD
jgi:hypothetical protein